MLNRVRKSLGTPARRVKTKSSSKTGLTAEAFLKEAESLAERRECSGQTRPSAMPTMPGSERAPWGTTPGPGVSQALRHQRHQQQQRGHHHQEAAEPETDVNQRPQREDLPPVSTAAAGAGPGSPRA